MGFEEYKAGTPYEEFLKAVEPLSEGSRELYKRYLNEFLDWKNASPQDLFDWVRRLEASPDPRDRKQLTAAFNDFTAMKVAAGISVNTTNNYKKAIHKFLDANELTIRIKKNGGKLHHVGQDIVSRDQVKKLIELASTNLRLRALLYVLKDSGLGVSEICMLTCEDFLSATQIKDEVGRRFITWGRPLSRKKTGELCHVCLGPESIAAVEDYLGNRSKGPIFITSKGQPHWNDEGVMTAEAGFTDKGSPMTPSSVTTSIKNHCKVLKAKGYKVSAHSFRKLFETSFSLEGCLDLAKTVMGKSIPASDKPYLQYKDKRLTKYAEVYTKHLMLSDEGRELAELKQQQAQRDDEVEKLKADYAKLLGIVNEMRAPVQGIKDEMINLVDLASVNPQAALDDLKAAKDTTEYKKAKELPQ